MLYRLLTVLLLLVPLTAGAVYFPAGIDWTNPSQSRFAQSLYLNMLGRAPNDTETQKIVQTLRRNDNRTARLRAFQTLLRSTEYRRTFNESDNSWQVFQAPDYNYNNGQNSFRYQAARSQPQGFTKLPRGNRIFSESVARSVAHYYDAYCYEGDPCIDNPEFARDRSSNTQIAANNAHACAVESNLDSQFKWVAVNGTTYPRGIGRQTICLENAYFEARQLSFERYDCDAGYTNCQRNSNLDLRASRSGTDNDGHPSFFFRDGSRLALIETGQTQTTNQTTDRNTNNTVITQPQQTDPLLLDGAHACADPTRTNSRFTWQTTSRTAESRGVGTTTVCMDNYYYAVQRLELKRYNCDRGFINCRPDPNNDLTATKSTRVDGNPALVFPNGTTLTLTSRNQSPTTSTTPSSRTQTNNQRRQRPATEPRTQTNTNTQRQVYGGADCADSTKRLSQFRWKSQGLSSWPDGIEGRIICLNNSYYEVTSSMLRNYSCQRNYTSCTANPSKNIAVRGVSQDGTIWTLANSDEVTLITR